jgi:hypothetical protein
MLAHSLLSPSLPFLFLTHRPTHFSALAVTASLYLSALVCVYV